MIRVIAVDDELPALKRVGKLLQPFDAVEVCGLFDSAKKCLDFALTSPQPFDLALLDMEMPGLHGLELARRLRMLLPEVHIVFVTAHEEFARDAFDIEALDYLLKPITEESVQRMLIRYGKRSGRKDTDNPSGERIVSVRSFGSFAVTDGNEAQVRFRNSKSRELLAYLHHHGGKPVGKTQIMEELWPGSDADRSQVNLHSTVYQLRKDLEAYRLLDAIVHDKTAGSYCVRWPGTIACDVADYEQACRQFRSTSSLTPLLRAIRLYGDGYLAGTGYGWAVTRQAELEMSYTELLEALIDTYVRQGRYDFALGPLRKGVQLLPLDERLHGKMVALLLLMNREADAKDYYDLVSAMLEESEEANPFDFSSIAADPSSYFKVE